MRAAGLVLFLVIALTPLSGSAEDWSVERSPFDSRIVARYKALLNRQPHDAHALRELTALYRKHRSLKALIGEYQELAEAHPRPAAYQIILGHLYRQAGQLEQALACYERASEGETRTAALAASLAALYQQLGRSPQAIQAYQQALSLTRSPRERKLYLRALVRLALAANDLEAAQRDYEQLIALEPTNIALRTEFAQALAKGGREEQAIAQYRLILQREGDPAARADTLKEIGGLLHKRGDTTGAVAAYRQAMALTAPGHWLRRELTDLIIAVYREKEDLRTLIEHYEKTWQRRGAFEHEVLGRLYDETGDEPRALQAYRGALRLAPQAIETRVRLIALLERSGRQQEVMDEYRKLARYAPGEPKYQLELATRLHGAGQATEALHVLEQCALRFPADASVQAALADLYGRWGDAKRALRAAQALVRIEPADAAHLINLGEQYYVSGQKHQAMETWRRLLHVVPQQDAALAKLAEVYAEHSLLGEAKELLKRAIKLQPKQLSHHRSLALLLEKRRETDAALQSWEEVLKLASVGQQGAAQREARSHVIDILHRTYKLPPRLREYRLAFEQTPQRIDAGFMLAESFFKLGHIDEAVQVYRRIVELDPQNLEALNALETAYRQQGQLTAAIEVLKRMAKLQPKLARDYYQRIADLHLQLYHDKEAEEYARKALTVGNPDGRSYQRLGELYERKEDYPAALKAYREALRLAPHRAQARLALARLLSEQGKYADAEAHYRQLVSSARTPETVRKAFRMALELSAYLGKLTRLEKELLPLSTTGPRADLYRSLLAQLYRRLIPELISRTRTDSSRSRDNAREELRRIGVRGIAPLLEELAASHVGNRVELIEMLGYLGNANAVIPLLRIAREELGDGVLTIYGSTAAYAPSSAADEESRVAQLVNQRVEAIVALGRIGAPSASDALVALLADPDGPIRDAAAWALARLPGRSASKALFKALGDPRPTVQLMACVGLGLGGEEALRPALEEVMADRERDGRVRAGCAWALGLLGDATTVGSLGEVLREGEEPLQRAAAWSLGALRFPAGLPPLVRSLWSQRQEVRETVLWALVQLSTASPMPRPLAAPDITVKNGVLDHAGFLASLLTSPEPRSSAMLDEQLARVVQTQQQPLVEGLRAALQRHRDVVLRALADLDADAKLPELGPLTRGRARLKPEARADLDRAVKAVCREIRPAVAALLAHRDPLVRERAISVYAKLAPPDLHRRMQHALVDAHPAVRLHALEALGNMLPNQLTPALLALLADRLKQGPWREREVAARVLGSLPAGAAGSLLVRAARDGNGFVREAAVAALGQVGGALAAPALLRALDDPIPHVRAAACRALARSHAASARPQIEAKSRDPSARVRQAAAEALRLLH